MRNVVPLLFATAGCTDSTEPERLDERDAFAQDLSSLICQASQACCADKSLRTPSDVCLSSQRNDAFIQFINADRDQRVVTLTSAQSCLNKYQERHTCGDIPLAEQLPQLCPELFSSLPEGHADPGSACSSTADCAAPAVGTRTCLFVESNAGRCTWLVPVSAGQPCADSEPSVFHICEEGTTCRPPVDSPTDARTCGSPAAAGEECFDRFGCTAGYACYANETGTYQCQKALALGARCAGSIDACDPHHFCDLQTETCKILPVFDECSGGSCEPYAYDKVCR